MKSLFVPVLLAVALTGMATAQDAAPPAPESPEAKTLAPAPPAVAARPAAPSAPAPFAQGGPPAPPAPPARFGEAGPPPPPPPPPPESPDDAMPPLPAQPPPALAARPAPPAAPAMPAPPAMFAQSTPPVPPTPPTPATPAVPPPPPMNWYAAGKGSFLGIGVQEIDPDRAKRLKISEPHGVEVTTVAGDSPAAKAGLKEGDAVLEFNGQRVEGVEQFVRLVRETPPGRTVKLLINRDGNTQTVAATVGDRKAYMPHMDPKFAEDMTRMGEEMRRQFGPDSKFQQDMQKEFGPNSKFRQEIEGQFGADSQFQRDMQKLKDDMQNMHWDGDMHGPDSPEGPGSRGPRLGIETEPVGSQLAEFFGVKQGVLVRSVAEGSAAAKAGIKAGDVIVKVGNAEVGSPGQITKLLRDAEAGKPVPVTVVRNKREMTVNVTPGPRPGAGHSAVSPVRFRTAPSQNRTVVGAGALPPFVIH